MSQSLQPNRRITSGDREVTSPARKKLSPTGVLLIKPHKDSELCEVPMSFLEWLRDKGVFDTDPDATRLLAKEFKQREKRGGRAIPTQELVSPLGNVLFGQFENLNIDRLKQHQLQDLLTVRHVRKASKERIRNRLRKLSQK